MSRITILATFLVAASITVAACQTKSADEGDDPSFIVPQSPLLGAFERKVGLIAYIGADGNVYTVDQSGQNPAQITDDARLREGNFHYYNFPTWSPDGKSLAFYGVQGTSEIDLVSTVYTSDAEGQTLVETYTSDRHVPIYLMWSPDSSQVTFISNIAGGPGLVLNMVPAAGGESQVLDVGAPYYWDWLPDSSGVLVHTGGPASTDAEARLALLTLTEGVVEDTLALRPAAFKSPALSPDGSKVLLAIEADGESKLVITDRLGNIENEIDTVDGPVAFAWSPDGQRVAYIVGQAGQQLAIGKLMFVELGEQLETAETEQDQVLAFFWAPDSKQVAYLTLAQFTPEPDPEAPESATAENMQYYLKLYVSDTAGKAKRLFSFVPPDDFWRMLPYFDQYARSATIWSPDSQNLVVPAYISADASAILVVSASGVTEPRLLQEGAIAFWSAK